MALDIETFVDILAISAFVVLVLGIVMYYGGKDVD